MSDNVRREIVGGHLVTTIDDTPYREAARELRRETGDGIIRDRKGRAVAQHALSIPVEEMNALLQIGDADAVAWRASGCQDLRALRRLVLRYPHWLVSDGAVLRRFFQ